MKRTTVAHVSRVLLADDGPDPILLLGAGASVRSGVPAAAELAEMAARWGYCNAHGRSHLDPQVTRSDWWPWLREQSWFDQAAPLVDQYPVIVEQLLQPRANRREFFLQTLKHRAPPSVGYGRLADLVAGGLVRTILTPNFDGLIPEALRARPEIRHFESIESPSDFELLSTAPPTAQVVWVHGSVTHYSDQNLEDETRALNPKLRQRLRPLLADHPLVVIGYRGAEPSITLDLLLGGADAAHSYRHGIYWCVRNRDVGSLHPCVERLAERLGPNLQLVPIEGFDECMEELAEAARRSGRRAARGPVGPAAADAVHDLRPSCITLEDLDWDAVSRTLAEYARALGLTPPDEGDRVALTARLAGMDLVVATDGVQRPTRAGELLFAREREATVEVRFGGARVPVRGNLLQALATILDLLDEVNAPYRLKGPLSEDVRRFDPAAVKELVVNALVHRDYERPEPIRITVSDENLQVTSPGGLLAELSVERLGQPGVKAYRNPVVADVMYGTGAMDKAGSGLADARRWARAAGGDAEFAPAEENTAFVAALRGRAEQPHPVTGTADPGVVERFLTNVLPVSIESAFLQNALCPKVRAAEILKAHPAGAIPAFFLHEGRLWTFSDLADKSNALKGYTYGQPTRVPLRELLDDGSRERLFVQLLNRMLFGHAASLGLAVYRDKRRLWFPRLDEGPRTVTYRARVREATRTVTKPLPRRRDGQRRWEHESVAFSFRRYGQDWALHLVPGWTFTHDGVDHFMRGPRVAALATRRAARDYNPQVSNHLYFWLWAVTRGQDSASIDPFGDAVNVGGRFITLETTDMPGAVAGFAPEIAVQDEVSREVAELGDQQAA
jgi:Putative ATP-dependent DNA helicase recG C-terminal/SIR2-like domain